MRYSLWLGILMLGVTALVLRLPLAMASAPPNPKESPPAVQPAGKALCLSEKVRGKGATEAEAQADAVNKACYIISRYVADEIGETNYTPTQKYMQEKRIVPLAHEITTKQIPADEYGRTYEAELLLQLTPDQAKDMQKQAKELQKQARNTQKEALVESRQHAMGLGLAGVTALLLVAIGYLRLEEATKGYYTGLLRIAAPDFSGGSRRLDLVSQLRNGPRCKRPTIERLHAVRQRPPADPADPSGRRPRLEDAH